MAVRRLRSDPRPDPARATPRRRACAASALLGTLSGLLLCACSDAAPRRATIVFDVDPSGCSAASCAAGGELFVLRGARVAGSCLLAQRSLASAAGQQSYGVDGLASGEVVSFALTLHCGGQRCAACQAVAERVTLRDGQHLALRVEPAAGCIARGELPGGVRPRTCGSTDGGAGGDGTVAADAGGLRDLSVADSRSDQRVPGPDSAAGKSCSQVYACAQNCKDLACVSSCNKRGCASAQKAFTAIINCGAGHCISQCSGGFASVCLSCLKSHCGPQLSACLKQKC